MSRLQQIQQLLLDSTPRENLVRLQRRLNRPSSATSQPTEPSATGRCTFVLSTGRVGSKTLAALLDLPPGVAAVHEPKPLLYGLAQQAYYYGHLHEVRALLTVAMSAVRRDPIEQAWQQGKHYVETSPQSTFLAPNLQALFPEARFLYVTRHPGDVVRSAMRRGWYSGHPFDATRIKPRPDDPYYTVWPEFSLFQKNVWLWHATNQWILDFCATLPAEHMLHLRSEAIFAGDDAALARLYDFVEQPTPTAASVRRVLAQQLNVQRQGEFPPASEWSEAMRVQFNAIAGDTTDELGYAV